MNRGVHFRWTEYPHMEGQGSFSWILATNEATCGIYWLTFTDGMHYVGQSVKVEARLSSHRRRWFGEIATVRFAPWPAHDLDRAERGLINTLVARGLSLRNKASTPWPQGLSDVTWESTTGETVPLVWDRTKRGVIVPGQIVNVTAVDDRKVRQHARLAATRHYPVLLTAVRSYVDAAVPSPILTAPALWTMTALPATNQGRDRRRLLTVNAGRLETLRIFEQQGALQCAMVNVALPDSREARRLDAATRRYGIQVARVSYSRDTEVTCLTASVQAVAGMMRDPAIADLAYRLTIRYMRLGSNPLRRHHNPLLLRDVVAWKPSEEPALRTPASGLRRTRPGLADATNSAGPASSLRLHSARLRRRST